MVDRGDDVTMDAGRVPVYFGSCYYDVVQREDLTSDVYFGKLETGEDRANPSNRQTPHDTAGHFRCSRK